MGQDSAVPLLPAETLLWKGNPDPRRLFMPADVFLVPFYTFFLVFVIFWTVTAVGGGAPPFFGAVGAVFLVIGLYATIGRFIVKTVRAMNTVYVVTDQRAVIRTPWSTREVRLASAGIELITRGAGTHLTVIFSNARPGSTRASIFSQQWMSELLRNSGMEMFVGGHSPAFYNVADVDGLRAALEPTFRRTPPPSYQLPPYGS